MNQFTIYIDKDLTPRYSEQWPEEPSKPGPMAHQEFFREYYEDDLPKYAVALSQAKRDSVPFDIRDEHEVKLMCAFKSGLKPDSIYTIQYDGTIETYENMQSEYPGEYLARLIPSKPKEEKQNTIVDMQKFGQIEKEFGDVSTPEKPDNSKPDFEDRIRVYKILTELSEMIVSRIKNAATSDIAKTLDTQEKYDLEEDWFNYLREKLYSDIYLPKVREMQERINNQKQTIEEFQNGISEELSLKHPPAYYYDCKGKIQELRDKIKTLEEENERLKG